MKHGDATISIPVLFFINALQGHYSRELRFFILLKLIYPNGKTKLTNAELRFLELNELISRETLKKYIRFLLKMRWVHKNAKTGYYILKGIDKIRRENAWQNRNSIQIGFHNYKDIYAVSGAVLYAYLHRGFWKNLAKRKSVQIMGSTFHFPHSRFNFKQQPAPVSVSWVARYFEIAPAYASKLKSKAEAKGLIKVTKNYGRIIPNKLAMQKSLEYQDAKENIVFHNGFYRFQLIDTVYPLFYFTKRKSIEA